MYEEEDNDVKEIVAHVLQQAKKGSPPQYGEIHDHFGWGQGKWAKKWKEARKYLDSKRPSDGGYPKYNLKEHSEKDVEEALYKNDNISDISKDDLHQAKIPRETIDRAWSAFEDAHYAKAIRKAGLLDMAQTMMKFARGEWQFFKEIDVEERVRRFSEAFDIGLSYPKGEIPPQIPEWAYWMLLHITSASQGFPPHVEKFKIILSFDATRIKQRQCFDEKAFAQWLERFKKQRIKPDILGYLKTRASSSGERMRPESVNPDELVKFNEYNIEFTKKETSYMTMMNRLIERWLKEDPILFQKYVSNKRFRS